jgi:3-dehydroshikimate dehydratase
MQLLLNTIMLEVNRWTADHLITHPLIDLLDSIKTAGFDELEIWQYHISSLGSDEVEALAQKMQSLDMRTVALGAYPSFHLEGTEADAQVTDLDRLVDYAAALGVSTFKIFPGRLASADADPATRALSVERLNDLGTRLAGHSMDLTMETHGNTLCDTLESTQQLLEELSDHVGLCFQPYTEHDTDQAIATYNTLRPAISHIHLQNRNSADGTATLLQDGNWIDYTRFLPHVVQSGFDGLLSLEFTEGLFPAEGEKFDPQTVIDNAVEDRKFVMKTL